MDPVSQGVLGAALPSALANKDKLKTIIWVGFLAGMAPDLDVLIQSPTDPILFLEYHRQFTHALAFIPIGALLCALVFHRFARHRLRFRELYLACFLGYATHGLLDACTTYGTQLFWPFSNQRVAWNSVSIIDPLFTLPLLTLMGLTLIKSNPWYARAAMIWALSYLAFGALQRDRAESLGQSLAEQRGHIPLRLSAKPGFANLFLWKVVYETDSDFYVDAVRTGLTPTWFEGEHIRKLNIGADLPWLDPRSQQADDLRRFNWFSMDYLAIDKDDSDHIIDIRYSMLPNEINALWGIRLDRQAGIADHAKYVVNRDMNSEASRKRMQTMVDMLFGR
jgi:inner membrane protein